MPPKGSRGGRGGRGRGGAGNTPSNPPSIAPDVVDSQPASDNPNTTMTDGSSQDIVMQDTPVVTDTSTSATSQPPAPAPTRTPAQALTRGRGRGRGASSAGRGAAPVAAPPAFKPKAVRRDQTERQRIADEERKRMEDREKAAERGRGRGRGRGTRGRGDAMGRRLMSTGTATGLFSQLPQALPKGVARPVERPTDLGASGWEAKAGGATATLPGRAKSNQTSHSNSDHHMGGTASGAIGSSDGVKIKKELPDPVYPSFGAEEAEARGVEIVFFEKNKNEEDVIAKGKDRASELKNGLKPIRVHRDAHKERKTVVNTDASAPTVGEDEDAAAAETDDSGMFVEQDLEAEQRRRASAGLASRDATGKPWTGVWSDADNDVKIKPEPGTQETMDIDDIPAPEPPKSPAMEKIKTEVPSPQARPRVRRAPVKQDRKPVLQTDEDKAEWARQLEDVAIMTGELEAMRYIEKPKTTDANGDVKMEDSEDTSKEGRLYLFQFPPVLPPLYNPDSPDKIKSEPGLDDEDVVQTSRKPAPGITGSSTAPIDLSKTLKPTDFVVEGIKAEPDDNTWKKPEVAANPIVPEEGYLGKLIVRESGKVEMSWGGNSFELSRGAQHQFLMTGLLMDGLEGISSKETNVEGSKSAYSMGSIMGKFNVTPDWDVADSIL